MSASPRRPRCARCTATSAPPGLQTRGAVTVGRYRQQYIYTCPTLGCHQIVEPHYRRPPRSSTGRSWASGSAIATATRREDPRANPRGIERYWAPLLVPVEGRDGKQAAPVDQPARTTRENDGIAMTPFIAELRGGGSKHRPVTDPLCTVVANGNHHGLVTTYYGNGGTRRRATRWPPSPRSSAMRF
ncbi:putative gp65 [Mycobacterium xenopi 3993]|nr:putative gp65 [Mycobacterium xenopi 3993]